MKKILINTNKFNGQYVAIENIDNNKIVGNGNSPEEAIKTANKKGIKNPFIIYIPDKETVHIYKCQ